VVLTQTPADAQSWEDNSDFWIEIMHGRMDRFRTELTDVAVLDAGGDLTNRKILDAGCGEGYLSRAIAERGGVVVGVDSSRKLIAAADAANHMTDRMTFKVGDITQLEFLQQSDFDVVVANHVINELPEPAPAFTQFAGVLVPGGTLVILMLHPCFYATRRDRERGVSDQSKQIARNYFSPRRLTDHFNVAGLHSPAPASRYLRPLDDYTRMLTNAGFVITDMAEPRPSDAQLKDPWWRDNFRRPLFLLITARLDRD